MLTVCALLVVKFTVAAPLPKPTVFVVVAPLVSSISPCAIAVPGAPVVAIKMSQVNTQVPALLLILVERVSAVPLLQTPVVFPAFTSKFNFGADVDVVV